MADDTKDDTKIVHIPEAANQRNVLPDDEQWTEDFKEVYSHESDSVVHRGVVFGLLALAFLSIFGSMVLRMYGKEASDFVSLPSLIVGVLGGLFAKDKIAK